MGHISAAAFGEPRGENQSGGSKRVVRDGSTAQNESTHVHTKSESAFIR